MKRLMLAALTVALVAGNPLAHADDGWKGGKGNGHGGSYSRVSSNGSGHGHNPGYNGHGGGGGYNPGYNGHGGGYKPGYYRPAYGPGYGHHGGNKWYGPARYYYPRPYYGYPRAYYGYRPVGYPYYPYYPQHHNNNNNNDSAAYLVGGLVVGSLLTNAYNKSQANSYYAQQPANQVVVAPQGRRLLRDLNGNCYERTTDAAGNELRTELPPSQCNW